VFAFSSIEQAIQHICQPGDRRKYDLAVGQRARLFNQQREDQRNKAQGAMAPRRLVVIFKDEDITVQGSNRSFRGHFAADSGY
jgi:hypothetical protein